jgi:AcrR family transcriptional regulator
MTGLRQRQKIDRDRRIVEAAARLFREFGFEGVKIETIAEQAGVSVGTIYNYYESKGDVLIAVVSLEVNEVISAGEGVLTHPPARASDAVDALFDIYLRPDPLPRHRRRNEGSRILPEGLWRRAGFHRPAGR